MSKPTSEFSQFCADEVTALRRAQPTTAEGVVALVRVFDPADAGSRADAVYSGPDLFEQISPAGWQIEWREDACWLAVHPETGSRLGHYEGLLYAEPSLAATA
ncbi:hypothetical protein [Dermacoccus barathri]|uniref:hypothetical protein n=1 Tax=Dermacoccus barathri TaxID=322601 RepID=UPI00187923DB|nr:hypothetical protein [Dermacoccus barathri]MBE7372882.1 hypothetical protein [Dermacoccus barathri]